MLTLLLYSTTSLIQREITGLGWGVEEENHEVIGMLKRREWDYLKQPTAEWLDYRNAF